MDGTIAVTDYGWYRRLSTLPNVEEVNFWKPSAHRTFRAPELSPFLFKLKAPHRAICGFGFFARYSRLPDWLAWESFGLGNGCESLAEMRERIAEIRDRIRYREDGGLNEIGCILLVQPVFFSEDLWVAAPSDWHVRTQSDKKYDLSLGEGARVWRACLEAAQALAHRRGDPAIFAAAESVEHARFGAPILVRPRLGQGTFRIGVMDAYERACAVTGEHSLPALDAAHIRPYTCAGPHQIRNGILLRSDFHRLFDKGYLTIGEDRRLKVSERLRADYKNGRSYLPFRDAELRAPRAGAEPPAEEFLDWHRHNVFLG